MLQQMCCQLNMTARTWHAVAKLSRKLCNKVVINSVLERTKNEDWPCVLHCNTNKILAYVIPSYAYHNICYERLWYFIEKLTLLLNNKLV